MLIPRDQILNFIPQRAPFVMINTLDVFLDGEYSSTLHISEDNIFVEGGELREYALIENIAQTGAAGIAFERKNNAEKVREGFIGGISKLTLNRLPKVGDSIVTIVKKKAEIGNLFLLNGKVYSEEKLIFECDVQLAGNNE